MAEVPPIEDGVAPGAGGAAASMVALFLARPVLVFVMNALLVIAGLAALNGIEIRELPQTDSPVLTVTTTFDGAVPETVDREVTAVVEGAVSRVPGVRSVSSSSRFGQSRVVVELTPSTEIDSAVADVREVLSRAAPSLPDGTEPPRVFRADTNGETVMRISLTSPTRPPLELSTLAEELLEDRLMALPGVADVQFSGTREAAFRVDVDLLQLAGRGLGLAEVADALKDVARDVPTGSLGSGRQTMLVRATAALSSAAELEGLTVAPGVRLGDVATVFFVTDRETSTLRTNGLSGIGIGIVRQPQSNTLRISDEVHRVLGEVLPLLPSDVSLDVSFDAAVFVAGALREIRIALGLSVAIVALIVLVFLRNPWAALIPLLAIPVSLVGTLAALWLVGFSINILTLLALVLATGLVVDDAIVVLENIARKRAAGLGPRAAAVEGTRQVFFAVIATTTTLVAVFIPLSFLPGQTGRLFREFGFTLAIAVTISAFVALTLCPVLASRLPAPRAARDGARRAWLPAVGGWLADLYRRTLHACLSAPLAVVVASLLIALTAVFLQGDIRRELTPPEDRSVIMLNVQGPQAAGLRYTEGKVREIEAALAPLQGSGEIRIVYSIIGGSAENRAFMVLTLAPWEGRARGQQDIARDIGERMRDIIGVRVSTLQPNSLGIRGAGQGLTFALVGKDYDALAGSAADLVARMAGDPGFVQTRLGYERTQPQLLMQIDRERADDIGVDIASLDGALRAVLDGWNVATLFQDGDSYDVRIVAANDPVNDPADLERIFVPGRGGRMVPLSAFVDFTETPVAPELQRESLLPSVTISTGLAPDLSLGPAIERVAALASEVVSDDSRIVPLAEARALQESSAGLRLTFVFALVVVLLVLAAQFESFVSAMVVMATVPLGLACAVFALVITGGSLNIFSQIGLVLLVGIMAKNGILIVEFADQLRERGASPRAAVEAAARIRLRPMIMTMLASVLGALPLVFAHGAGAEARSVLGAVIVGGLGLATLATLYATPVAYALLAGLARHRSAEAEQLTRELAEARAGAAGSRP